MPWQADVKEFESFIKENLPPAPSAGGAENTEDGISNSNTTSVSEFESFVSSKAYESGQKQEQEVSKITEDINNKLGFLKYSQLQYDLTELHSFKVELMKDFSSGERSIEQIKNLVGEKQRRLKKKYGALDAEADNPATFIFGQGWGQVPNTRDALVESVPWAAVTIPAMMVRNKAITAAGAAIGSVFPGVGTAAGAAAGSAIGNGEAVVEGLVGATNISTFIDTAEKEGYGFYYDAVVNRGLEPEEAKNAAALVGVINGAAELVSFNVVLGPFAKLGKGLTKTSQKQIARETVKGLSKALKNPTVADSVKTALGQLAKTMGAEVTTEELQEVVTILGETSAGEKISHDEAVSRLKEVGITAAAAPLLLGAFSSVTAVGAQRVKLARQNTGIAKAEEGQQQKAENVEIAEEQQPAEVEETPPGVEQTEEFTDGETVDEGTDTVTQTPKTQETGTETREEGMDKELAETSEKQQKKLDEFAEKEATTDSPKQIEEARKRAVRNEIKTKDNELNQLSKRWDKAFKEGNEKEVAGIESEMDRLINERQNLEQEREFLSAGIRTKEGVTEENKDITFGAKEFQDEIVGVKRAERVLKAINKGFKSGQTMTKASLKIAQKEFKNLLRQLPQSERGKVAFDFQKFNSVEEFKKNAGDFEARVNKILKQAELKAYQKAVAKQLKKAKPTKLSERKSSKSARGFKTGDIGVEEGQQVADIQAVLGDIQKAVKDEEAALTMLRDAIDPDTGNPVNAEIADAVLGYKNKDVQKTKKLYEMLNALLEGRKTAAMKKMEKEQKVFEEQLQQAKESIQGDTPANFDKAESKKDIVTRFMRAFGVTFDGWAGVMNILGMHDKNNVIQNITDVFENTKAEHKGRREAVEKFQNKLREKLPEFQDERIYEKKMNEDAIEKDWGAYIDADGNTRKLIGSKSEIRKLWMEFQAAKENGVIRYSFEKGNKYTFEDTEGATPGMTVEHLVNEAMDNQDVKIAEAQLEFYDEYYSRANDKFYRAKHGIDMPREKKYSPIRREVDENTNKGAWFEEYQFRVSAMPSAMKTRTISNTPLKTQSDIVALSNHIAEIEHGIAWDTKVKQSRNIFGNNEVKKIIKEKYGNGTYKVIKKFIDDFAMGGQAHAEAHTGIVDALRRNFTKSVLGLKPALAVKQQVSMFTFADEVGVRNYIRHTADFFRNPQEAINTLKESEILKARGLNIDRDMAEISKVRRGSLVTPNPKFNELLFATTRFGDKGAIYVGGWSVYKQTLEETGSKEKAMEAFERAFDSTQQSGNLYQLSEWQRGNAFARLFTMFTSSQNMYFRKEVHAIRNLVTNKVSAKEAARTIFIYHFFLPTMFQYVANLGRWDDGEMLRASILGSLNGVFLLGDLAEIIVGGGLYYAGALDRESLFESELPTMDTINSVLKAVEKVNPDDIEAEDVFKAVEVLASDSVGPATGLPIETFINMIEGVGDIAEGETGKGLYKTAGWSPYIVDKKYDDKRRKTVKAWE